MDLNGVYTGYSNYSSTNTQVTNNSSNTDKTKSVNNSKASNAYSNVAATYDSSDKSSSNGNVKVKKDNSAIIAQMKSDTEARMAQMQSLVTKMFEKQGVKIGNSDDMWKALAKGDFSADPATIAQAKEDISEDGYWGVSKTSERIFSFATALAGGDDEKMQKMVKAVQKGFSEATKSWGKELPDISNSTYSAVMDKFDQWFKDNHSEATTADLLK